MAKTYDLAAMLEEIEEDEGQSVASPEAELSQDDIQKLLKAQKRPGKSQETGDDQPG